MPAVSLALIGPDFFHEGGQRFYGVKGQGVQCVTTLEIAALFVGEPCLDFLCRGWAEIEADGLRQPPPRTKEVEGFQGAGLASFHLHG